LFMGTVPINSI